MAAGQINDGKPPEPQSERAGDEEAFVVGAAMRDGTRHAHNRLALDGLMSLEVKLSGYAAHSVKEVES